MRPLLQVESRGLRRRALIMISAVAVLSVSGRAAADNVITMGYGEGSPGDSDVRVIATARNELPIHGYSIAFTYPAEALDCTEVTILGTHIQSLILKPVEFIAPNFSQPGIASLGVIFDFDSPFESTQELAARSPDECPIIIARISFDVKANAPGGIYPLRLMDGIGQPAIYNIFTNSGHTIRPRLVDGSFVISGGNVLSVDRKIAAAGATPNLAIYAHAEHPDPLAGFQVAIKYHNSLSLNDLKPGEAGHQNATHIGTDVDFFLRNRVEFATSEVDAAFTPTMARATYAALFDYVQPFDGQALTPSTSAPGHSILKFTFNVGAAADDVNQWQDLILDNSEIPGLVDNRFIVGDRSLDPTLKHGKIYFSFGTLRGRVIDCDTQDGVPGVRVSTDPEGSEGVTNASGAFLIESVIPGPYTLLLSKPGNPPEYYSIRHFATEQGQSIVVRGAPGGNPLLDDVGALIIYKIPTEIDPCIVDPSLCEDRPFARANINGDARVDISDAIFLLAHLFQGGMAPQCKLAADANDDEKMDLSDSIYLLSYLFAGGSSPPPPFSQDSSVCTLDPTASQRLSCFESNCR